MTQAQTRLVDRLEAIFVTGDRSRATIDQMIAATLIEIIRDQERTINALLTPIAAEASIASSLREVATDYRCSHRKTTFRQVELSVALDTAADMLASEAEA